MHKSDTERKMAVKHQVRESYVPLHVPVDKMNANKKLFPWTMICR